LCTSKSDARRAIEQGGVYINGTRQTDLDRQLRASDLDGNGHLLLQRGKRDKHVIVGL
jgi:tyrosyl-tRNA synthetase